MNNAFAETARLGSALAAPSRLTLLDRLAQGEQTVEQLAEAAGLSLSNTSRQLRTLAHAGLVVARREPPYVHYRLAADEVLDFWLAFRGLAQRRLAAVGRAVESLLAGLDSATPLTREALLERMTSGEVVLLDVRPVPEYLAGHIPGALSVPLDQVPRRLAELPPDREIVAYCRGPFCLLAAEAVQALRARGFRARRFSDGVPEWRAAGLPVVAGAAAGGG